MSEPYDIIIIDNAGRIIIYLYIVYVSCRTAKGGPGANNLCQATLDAGVDTVIGFREVVPADGCRFWMKKFTEYLCTCFGNQTETYNSIVSMAMNDTADENPDWMDFYDEGKHVVMDSCQVFGNDNLPGVNSWN